MSFVFIECEEFLKLAHSGEYPGHWPIQCCKACHEGEGQNRIYVTPFKDQTKHPGDHNTDWQLCVQGIVCCHLYNFVRSLPRSFWVAQSIKYNVGVDDGRGYIFPSSPHRNTDHKQPHSTTAAKVVVERRRAAVKQQQEDEESQGMSAYLNRR